MASQPSYEQSKQVAESSRETEWTQPSFGKQLFLGNFRLDLVHPQPELDVAAVEKGEAFLERLRTFLTERVDRQRIEREAKIPDDVLRGLGELGALGMKIPEEYGGLGLSQVYYNRALAMAGTWHSSISTLLSAHQSIGLPEPLRLFGSEEQKRHWLPRLARDHISAFLLTEPDVGSDPARMSTTAVPSADGTGYRINGTKLWATNGAIADVVVVMAVVPRSDGHRGGITAFLCPCDRAGITVEHRNEFMGLKGIENSVTRFDDVLVPTEDVIGGEGRGLRIALTTLNTGRLSLPAFCSSAVTYSLKIAREWSSERRQWGRPIGEHDPVAQKLAWLAGTAFGLEAVLDVSSRLADDKRNDIRIEAALAKLYSSELGWTAVDEMVQIRGGRAYETAESLARRGEKPVPAEQLLRDMRINRIFEGSTEIMHLLIAREAVDEHLRVAGDLVLGDASPVDKAKAAAKAGTFYARWLPTLATGAGQRPGSYAEFGELARHLRYVERHSRKLARSTFYAMGRHQARLEQKGHLLGRIVDIGAELYAISCACVYADTIGSEQPARRQEAAELADLFCRQARRRADRLFAELWDNDDRDQYRAAKQVLSGRYAWFEEDVLDPAGDGPMMPTHEPPAAEQFDEPAPTVPAAPAS
ncbi:MULTISPECIES: acyl-CoA dehydrogenase family protein [unclassified Modestobacter]|uniref:acyl-CoA dehydrogenase family protein n=1 Tax=unclassified Modestobacter TaxID=2643866 RepID=UPI0022AAB860|nr:MULTISPECIES: acyl-CoA dehydrogenase family protein [unclassified Modestobacter]MCZ2826152.1 acyl-CoA dehydrogenase family protein [Modestobacter sp. VKM Ac-2981]MCZ2852783.1 acyl-CoA dehydrogenase family protein [Modestobacter sp. VKM Ac-2982]